MIDPKAEESFRRGADLLAAGSSRDALAFLRAAIDQASDRPDAARPSARYYSYYGVCLYRARCGNREALAACRKAVALDDADPDLWWNLGRVAAGMNRRAEAWRAFQSGLLLESEHPGILQDMRRMGERRPPVLSSVRRDHPVNIALGRMRARLQGGATPTTASRLSEATR